MRYKIPVNAINQNDDQSLLKALRFCKDILDANENIKNSTLRKCSGMSYDEAIAFFKLATAQGFLLREGTSSGTTYSATDKFNATVS
jgi:hypothetical protein